MEPGLPSSPGAALPHARGSLSRARRLLHTSRCDVTLAGIPALACGLV